MPAEKADARSGSAPQRPRWPMIVCRTPKGWTGPKVVDGKPVEGTWRPVIFALHGYPGIIHKLPGRRRNHDNIHVRGYKVAGTATTPFDMVVLNNLARFLLALDAITRIPRLSGQVEHARQRYRSRRMTDRDPVESRPHGLRPGSDLSAG